MFPSYFSEIMDIKSNKKVPYSLMKQERPQYFTPHRHNFIELSYTIKGQGHEIINDKRHDLKPGVFSLILPYQVHTLYSQPEDPLTFYVAGISLEALFGSEGMWRGLEQLLFSNEEEPAAFIMLEGGIKHRMDHIFEELYLLYEQRDISSELLYKAKIVEAIVLFDKARRQETFHGKNEPTESGTSKDKNFWKVIYFVQTHYHENISLKQLSQRFHLSIPYLSTAFKRYIGVNYLEFLHEIRIQNACALLSGTELSVMDIAMEVGYDSYQTFSRRFLKMRGISAGQYRKSSSIQ